MTSWKDEGKCVGQETNIFYDIYENNVQMRSTIDGICMGCPVMKKCFSEGVSNKEWGVWGAVYLEDGQISKEFNDHRTSSQWADVFAKITHEGV